MNISATFQRPVKIKPSGADWLGAVPADWNIKRMKFLFRDYSLKGKQSAELLSVTQDQGVVPRAWVENRMVMPSGNLHSFKFIEKGDFAISLRSFEGGLEYCHHDGIISPAYTVLKKTNDNLNPDYFRYLFKSAAFISELQTSVVGIREGKNISFEELSYSLIPVPSLSEQSSIAAFLDEKSTKIDKAVQIRQAQIELLRERRQIIIQQAVTRGLNPDAPMRDSGIEWIGQMPAHWEVWKISHAFQKIGSGTTPDTGRLSFYEGAIPWLQTGDLTDSAVSKTNKLISESALKEYSALKIYPAGSLVMAMYGATIGKLGRLTIAAATNQACCVFSDSNVITTDFSFYSLLAMRPYILAAAYGGGQPNISQQTIKDFRIAVPPLSEQKEISEVLDRESIALEKAETVKQSQITTLKEYKTTLINAAVTGKIKVTGD